MRHIFLRVIAAAEMVGAVVLLAAAGMGWWALGPSAFPADFFPGAVVALITAVAGIQLFRLRPAGVKLSALAQALQVPFIASHWLNYKLVLGVSMLVTLNTDSGWLGFRAQLGDVESTVFVADDGSRAVGINLLAFALCWYLLRVDLSEGGEQRRIARKAVPRASLWRRVLRFTMISITVVLAIVLIPVLGLWIYNRIDEASAPATARWYSPLTHTIADRDNAWLAMIGIDAADGDDPIALARRRLDAHEARLALGGQRPESDAEKSLAESALPFDNKGMDGNKFDLFCDGAARDCIEWARAEAKNIDRIELANAIRAHRYENMLGMTELDELYTPSFNDLYPAILSDDALYRAGILRDLGIPAKRADALARLSRAAAFWQRVDGVANSMMTKMLGTSMRERYLRAFDAALNHSGPRELDAVETTAGVVLQPMTAAQKDWQPVLRNGTLAFDYTMRKTVLANPLDAFRYCRAQCLKTWMIAQFYAPHATQNLGAKLWDAILAVHEADPRDLSPYQKRVSELFDEIFPLQHSAKETAHRMAYNATGRIVLLESLPAYAEYLYRHHDVEGLRRLVQIKFAALKQRVRVVDMPTFLEAQPQELREVYSDSAFAWDATTHEIRFTVKAKKWKRDYFSVGYPKA